MSLGKVLRYYLFSILVVACIVCFAVSVLYYLCGNAVYDVDLGDSQNVHDSTVNADLVTKWRRLKEIVGEKTESEIEDGLRGMRRAFPHRVLDVIMQNRGYLFGFEADEATVAAYLWFRIFMPDNSLQRESLCTALRLALDSAIEEGEVVCLNGRTARLLDVLTLLDADQVLAAPLVTGAIRRREIMNEVRKLHEYAMASLRDYPEFQKRYLSGEEADDISEYSRALENYLLIPLQREKLSVVDERRLREEIKSLV